MPTVTDICNRALAAMGARASIASPEENSNEARACNLLYASTRDELLAMAWWNFARVTAQLSVLKAAPGTPENPDAAQAPWTSAYPPPPWLYSYAYPSDCLKAHFLIPQTDYGTGITVPLTPAGGTIYPSGFGMTPAVRFEVAADVDADDAEITVILANQPRALLVYSALRTDPARFQANFTRALVLGLAAKLCLQLSGDKPTMQLLLEQANAIVQQARVADANEGLTIQESVPDWIRTRGVPYYLGQPGGWLSPDYGPVW